jgi:hypothetical protein
LQEAIVQNSHMSLKRILQRGAGYARRRDRTNYGWSRPIKPTKHPEQQKTLESLPKMAFGCLLLLFLFAFTLLGIELLRRKILSILGIE